VGYGSEYVVADQPLIEAVIVPRSELKNPLIQRRSLVP